MAAGRRLLRAVAACVLSSRSRYWSMLAECLAVLILVVRNARSMACHGSVDLRTAAPEVYLLTWPFKYAASTYFLQCTLCCTVALAFWSPVSYSYRARIEQDVQKGSMLESTFLMRCQEACVMMAAISLLSGFHYASLAFTSDHHVGAIDWYPAMEVPRCLARYQLWSISASTQWIILCRLCTRASPAEVVGVVIPTVAVMQLGLSASIGNGIAMEVIPAFQWHRLYFTLSCALCFVVFKRVFALYSEPALASVRNIGASFLLCIWIMLPALQFSRTVGLVSAWTEQVGFTLLDIAAKAVFGVFITITSVISLFSSITFSVQIAKASQDVMLTVEDPGWRIMTPRSPLELATMEGVLGCQVAGLNFLEDLIKDEAQRQAVLQAAEQADSRACLTVQKKAATLTPPNSQGTKAECLISPSLYGTRQVSVVLLEPVRYIDDGSTATAGRIWGPAHVCQPSSRSGTRSSSTSSSNNPNKSSRVIFDTLNPQLPVLDYSQGWLEFSMEAVGLHEWFGSEASHRFSSWLQPLVNSALNAEWMPSTMHRVCFARVALHSNQDGCVYTAKITVTLADPLVAFEPQHPSYVATMSLESVKMSRAKVSMEKMPVLIEEIESP